MKKALKHTGSGIILLLAVSVLLVIGTTYAQAAQAKSETAKKAIVAPTTKTSYGSKALGPQPEPPDKPDPNSKALGPQPEPPDRQNPGSEGLGPQPEPPDRGLQVK